MQLEASQEIRAPAPGVFALISAPERLPQWNRSVSQARRLGDGPVALGSRATMVGLVLGRPLASETEVVGFDPPRWFETRALSGPPLLTTFRLEVVPYGTRLRVAVSGEVPGGKVGGFVAERILRTQLGESLRQLAALCEHEARRAATAEPQQEGGDPACWLHLQPDVAEGPSGTEAAAETGADKADKADKADEKVERD